MVWRPCGALVYAYRPNSLATYLSRPARQNGARHRRATTPATSRHALCTWHHASRSRAITPRNAPAAADSMRTAHQQVCCNNDCACEFPHEIGYFLGYPCDDVYEFIAQRGENYKVFGAWKVYANVEQALATFDALPRLHPILHLCLSAGLQLGATCPGNPIEHRSRGNLPHN